MLKTDKQGRENKVRKLLFSNIMPLNQNQITHQLKKKNKNLVMSIIKEIGCEFD